MIVQDRTGPERNKDAAARPADAASLILWRQSRQGVEVLMGLRSRAHRFMPGVLVFPGGRLDPADRSLFGHSYGGLFVLYTLFRQPGLFRAHVAASPSIGYGQGTILPLEAGFEAAPPEVAPRLRLLVTVGELEQPRPPAPISERARIARQVDRARDLVERLSQLGPAGPRVAFHLFPGETHQSVVDPAIRLGLDFVLQR